MARLMVRYDKRYPPFHPTMLVGDGRWLVMHFGFNNSFFGAGNIREQTLQEAIAAYFAELRRMNYEQVSE